MPRKQPSPSSQPTGTIVGTQEFEHLKRAHGANLRVIWGGPERPWNKPQILILTSQCDEIAALGGKGFGKSVAARAWLISGNPDKAETINGDTIPWNRSYAFHPEYHGLILRKNQEDLDEFINRAAEMYKPYGGEYISGQFRFPSGAIIDCGHMKDKNSWMKYLGIEYQRIVIEEAALIPDFSSYEQLRSCLRTTSPDLRCQILLTSNANGPGVPWITERFMKARDRDGNVYGPGEIIHEYLNDPDTGEEFSITRIWIFGTYKDNPAIIATRYGRTLVSLTDAKMRAAYLDGAWDALWGSYFADVFRPDGHRQGEPDNACHVITRKAMVLQPWWRRSIGMDWGYAHESAILWGCKDPKGVVNLYRELVAERSSPVMIGHQIALMSREELNTQPSHSMTMYLSHDAFNAHAEYNKSYAELIATGMAKVIGAKAVHLPDLIIRKLKEQATATFLDQRAMQEMDSAIQAIHVQARIGITIRIAEKTSAIGWQHCRELMRWESVGEINANFDPRTARQLLLENPKAFEDYARMFRDIKPEVLPKLQICKEECPRIIDAIPKAQHEEGTENVAKDHFRGKDSLDCFFYLMMGMLDDVHAEPFEAYRDEKLEEALLRNPSLTTNDLVHINLHIEQKFRSAHAAPAPVTPPRPTRARRLMRMGRLKDSRPDLFDRPF